MKQVKHAAKKTAGKASAKYGCGVCGTVIEVDPCGCGCDSAAALVCCGKKMARKRPA
ncbi:MAG: hypothetical protein HY952_03665 [Elusimicrobia bacterium]|nr:hypothetical protein [Elusimicrobiota bacterium]